MGILQISRETEPIRSISLASVTNVEPSDLAFPGKEHLFQIETPARTFYIQGETKEDTEEWIKAFKQVITGCRGDSKGSSSDSTDGSRQLRLFNVSDTNKSPADNGKEQSDDDDDD